MYLPQLYFGSISVCMHPMVATIRTEGPSFRAMNEYADQ